MKIRVNKIRAVVGLLVSAVTAAQAPAPAFDPAKLRAEMEAFMKMPDTVGAGKYPALKEEVATSTLD